MTDVKKATALIKSAGKWVMIIAVLGAVFYTGFLMGKPATSSNETDMTMSEHDSHEETKEESPEVWTCSMHPQIQLPESGKCPLCGMDLIPLTMGQDDDEPRRLVMSPADMKLAEIQTMLVERKFVDAKIRLVGKIEYDETLVRSISSYVPGRIDRLFVNYTGIEVKQGDHLAEIYSPDLLTAQEELLEAARRVAKSGDESSTFLRESDKRALESAREKLRLFGFSETQIGTIEKRGTPEDHMLITAPLGGVVVQKSLSEGDYVKTGSHIYTVADLTKVWVKLDAYESDLPWIHFGQHVDIQAEAYPGEHFDGVIAFIDPILDPVTRTVKIRVNVDNSDGRLKPGLFVRGTVHSKVAKGGRVMNSDLAGKWISPMHPEVVEDNAGDCRVCGMELVRAEDLGYVSESDDSAKPIVVPVTAVMKTGHRAIVYVAVPNAERPSFDGREIVLGPRAGAYYIVKSGLTEGERVVTNGNFNIDSALQIKAKPSMLSMEGETPEEGGDLATFRQALEPVYKIYFDTQKELAGDKYQESKDAFQHMGHQIDGIDMTLLEGDAHDLWMRVSRQVKSASGDLANATDIEAVRKAFDVISDAFIDIEKRFGHNGAMAIIEVNCPMAFDDGASWLQHVGIVSNPFLGADMPTCGNVITEFAPKTTKAPASAGGHNH